MKKRNALLLAGLMACFTAFAQEIARGTVYVDNDKNGVLNRNEKGVSGVAVSNGREVVLTDEKGRYEIGVGDDNIIFVVKPKNYSVPVNEFNQPQYYYIHKPYGSPESKYEGVKATGPLPKRLDFALYEKEEQNSFKALIFGDPQPYNLQELEYFRKAVVEEVESIKGMEFGLSLGDLVGDDLTLHKPYIETVGGIGVPWYNVMGNHDMNYDAKVDSLSDESFEASFGPANYAFHYGNAFFIVLDDILYPDPRDGKGYWGGFREDQLNFVENVLKTVGREKLIVLAFHIPLFHKDENTFRDKDRQRLFDILENYPHVLAMSAHTHLQQQIFYDIKDGWRGKKALHEYNAGTTSGDWYSGEMNEKNVPLSTMRDGTPRGYAILNVDNNKYSIEYKVAGREKEYQIELFHPKVLAAGKKTSAGIYANVFMGKKGDLVEYRVGDGSWKKMKKVEEIDPSYQRLLFDWDTTDQLQDGKRPSNPLISTHLWRSPIPTNLRKGTHKIEVRAVDMFGKTHIQRSQYRLE